MEERSAPIPSLPVSPRDDGEDERTSESLSFSQRGWISPQLVALVFLGLSISMVISAYRSLGREFSGIIVNKAAEPGISGYFWLTLAPLETAEVASEPVLTKVLNGEMPSRRVGVSRMVFNGARLMQSISKGSFSPFISIDGERYIDLGVQWLLWGILGIIVAMIAYRQGYTAHSPETRLNRR